MCETHATPAYSVEFVYDISDCMINMFESPLFGEISFVNNRPPLNAELA